MKTKFKVHPMEIPKEIIAGIFTYAKKQKLRIELVEVIGITALRVDLIYKKDQRKKAMHIIEQVDDFLHDKDDLKIKRRKNGTSTNYNQRKS